MFSWRRRRRRRAIDSVFEGARRIRSDDALEDQTLDHLERNQELREEYALKWAFVTKVQIGLTFLVLLAQGSSRCPWKLEPSVMIAFLGATSLNTLSVVLAISKGLFNTPKD